MHILVFGKSGQVATALAAYDDPSVKITSLDRGDADLSDPAACARAIDEHAPDAVINAAAFTAVDLAETQEDVAYVINADAPAAMALACARVGCVFVHISTDYVFSGAGTRPWAPNDSPDPHSAYGRTKQAGEQAVVAAGGTFAILRTSWVFSATGHNFVKTMRTLGAGKDHLRIVSDQIGAPTSAQDIANACVVIAKSLTNDPTKRGIYHFASQPDTNWADFARAIFKGAHLDCTVADIPSSGYPTPAKRPLNSRLDCTSTTEIFDIQRPYWRMTLQTVLEKLKA